MRTQHQNDILRLSLQILGHSTKTEYSAKIYERLFDAFHQLNGVYRASIWTNSKTDDLDDISATIESLLAEFI